MNMPTVQVIAYTSTSGGIQIRWSKPSDNFETITDYEILIYSNDASDFIESSYCNGALLVLLRSCNIPTSELIGANFLLNYLDAIQVKTRAYNIYGWGPYSTVN